jgi:hypothetical protein
MKTCLNEIMKGNNKLHKYIILMKEFQTQIFESNKNGIERKTGAD